MDFSQLVVAGAIIAGVTELLKTLRAKDYWKTGNIATAVLVGAILGATKTAGVPSVEIGILFGFATSGAIKTVSTFGNKSELTQSDVIDR